MNCVKGDLAVVVRSRSSNLGRVVRCERLATAKELDDHWLRTDIGAIWKVDVDMLWSRGPAPFATDDNLRPIRDPGEDARDESLSWLSVPSSGKVTA
jgi:hypothetical protein